MKGKDLYRLMSNIETKYIEEAMFPAKKVKKATNVRKILLIAACIALMGAAVLAIPLFKREVPKTKYDFTAPEYEDFQIEGTTLVSYTGELTGEIAIPEGIEEIADYAFYESQGASKLKVISLSSTVQSIGKNAFAGCEELEKLIVGENTEFIEIDGMLMTKDKSTIYKFTDSEAESVVIPEGVKYISAHAFQLSSLKRVVFPEGLLYIGFNAFSGLDLKEIHLPSSVIELGEGAFSGCIYALEGSYPENMIIGKNAFDIVPFYQTMLAGKPCPAEDILRGNVTLSEAFTLSNAECITRQFKDILAYYETGEIAEDTFCYGALYEAQPKPEGAILPNIDDLDFASLQIVERDLTSQTNVDIVIPCQGDYNMVIGYRIYDRFAPLYWQDVKWRAENISFIPSNAASTADIAVGDWYIEFEMEENGYYNAITFTNKNGKSYHEFRFPSEREYTFALSPDGNSIIVEYMSSGTWNFFIEDFTGKLYKTWWSYEAPCVPYFARADGDYFPHSAEWNTDPETMAQYPVVAENVQGRFLMDYSRELIRNNTYSGEDTVMYYDVKYIDSDTFGKASEPLYDGADKKNTDLFRITQINNETSEIVTNDPNLAVMITTPHTWNGILDGVREELCIYPSTRYEYVSAIYKVSSEYTENSVLGFGELEERVAKTFKRCGIKGEHVKSYSYVISKNVYGDVATVIYFVNIRTKEDYIIPIYFYYYPLNDDGDYFEDVIVDIIKSVRIADISPQTEIKATPNGEESLLLTTAFDNEKSERIYGELELYEICKTVPENELTPIYGGFRELGLFGFTICELEDEYYLYFYGMYENYTFKLEEHNWIRIG